MDLFSIILIQMVMLAIYVLVGIIGIKTKVMNREALEYISRFIMKLSLPIMIFTNTLNGATSREVIETLPMLLIAFCMYAVMFCIGTVVSRIFKMKGDNKQLYKALMMFGNVGFIGIPLIASIFPERGMLYIAIFTIADQGLLWTVGMQLTTPEAKKTKGSIAQTVKKMINPAIVGILLGVVGIFAGLKLPTVINSTLTKIGATTTPLSMIYIGGLFCYVDIKQFVKKAEYYVILLLKMIVFPVLLYLVIRNMSFISEEIKITLPILAGLPCMSSVAMFANANGADGDYAIGAIFVTTVASMATLPFVSYVIGTVF